MTTTAASINPTFAVPPSRTTATQECVAAAIVMCVVFFNEATFRDADVERFAVDWQIAMRLTICLACGVFGFFMLPHTLTLLLKWPGVWSLLFVAYATLTVPFAVHAKYSAAACAALWCVVLAAPAVLVALKPIRLLAVVLAALAVYLVGCWIAYLAVPEFGRSVDEYGVVRFGGLHHPNGTGRQAALAIALAIVAGATGAVRWRCVAPLLALAGVTLLLTDSRTGMLAALCSVAFIAFRVAGSAGRRALLASGIAVAIVWIGLVQADWDGVFSRIARSGDSDEIYTLTGRTDLWRFAIAKIAHSPLLGYGYGCSRFVIVAEHYWPTCHAHNLVLNLMLYMGFMGGGLVLVMFGSQLRDAARKPELFPDVMTVLILVGGLTDAIMFSPIPDSHTLLWLIALVWRPVVGSIEGDVALRRSEEAQS